MKKLILITFMSCLTLSCIKKEQEQNSEGQIVDLMNQNKADEALVKIDKEIQNNKSDELLYLKASSLSMKAGIDIYALFPLLKIKIFDVAISQWSQNREFQKKAQAQKNSIGVSNEDIEAQTDENKDTKIVEKYVPLDKASIVYKIDYDYMQDPYNDYRRFCVVGLTAKRLDKISDEGTYVSVTLTSKEECDKIAKGNRLSVTDEIDNKIRESIAFYDHYQWIERKKEKNRKNTYVKLMGTFWTLIDMVPMISKIPLIDQKGFSDLEEAQTLLSAIRSRHPGKGNELGDKARKQLMMISALKIVAHLKNAFNFDGIKEPMDFICSANDNAAEEIVASQEDAFYLINTIDDQEIINKNKKLFEELKEKYEEIVNMEKDNPEFKELRIKELRESLQKSKEVNCE